MAKTEKELQELKEKVEALDKELKELNDEELTLVSGGKVCIKADYTNGTYTD